MESEAEDGARRPRNWEALRALESVTPPSPSPSFGSDFITTLCSVGEIPIMLDSGIIGSEDSDIFLSLPSRPTLHATSSAATVDTVGTFGPQGSVSGSTISATSQDLSSGTDAVSKPTESVHMRPVVQLQEGGYYDRRISDASRFTISAYMSPSAQQIHPSTSASSRIPESHLFPESPGLLSVDMTPRLPHSSLNVSFNTSTSLSTLIFADIQGSTSPSVATGISTDSPDFRSASGWNSHPEETSPSSSVFSSAKPGSSVASARAQVGISSDVKQLSPSLSAAYMRSIPHTRTKSVSTTQSSDSGHSSLSTRSASDNTAHSATALLSKSKSQGSYTITPIPSALSWMENIVIAIWIDQEGFRLVRPAFKFSGYATSLSEDPPADAAGILTRGMAQFLPVKKDSYLFHYAPLENPPTLRKLTTADNDSRDYLSRQASLSIKTNGVYSVGGTESFDIGPASPQLSGFEPSHTPSITGTLKLTWHFEYRVDDNRPDVRGRQAEKKLTPLSFLCSPGLLHPTHGKKIKIMQVVKKNLIPKLSAARKEETERISHCTPTPTLIVSAAHHLHHRSPHARPMPDTRITDPRVLHPAHRRAHSTSTSPSLTDDAHTRCASDGIRGGAKKDRALSTLVGVRPPLPRIGVDTAAAAAVDDPPAALSILDRAPACAFAPAPAPVAAAIPSVPLARHILPPSEIANLLDDSAADATRGNALQNSLPPPLRHVAHEQQA